MDNSQSGISEWWTRGNAIVIWLAVLGLFVALILTSVDYSKPYKNFDKFGTYQLILAGIITFLLLYKNISKIKIGGVIDIETRQTLYDMIGAGINLADVSKYLLSKLPEDVFKSTADNELKENIAEKINNAKSQFEHSREILRRFDNV